MGDKQKDSGPKTVMAEKAKIQDNKCCPTKAKGKKSKTKGERDTSTKNDTDS